MLLVITCLQYMVIMQLCYHVIVYLAIFLGDSYQIVRNKISKPKCDPSYAMPILLCSSN
jgi:hypothetical protein